MTIFGIIYKPIEKVSIVNILIQGENLLLEVKKILIFVY